MCRIRFFTDLNLFWHSEHLKSGEGEEGVRVQFSKPAVMFALLILVLGMEEEVSEMEGVVEMDVVKMEGVVEMVEVE